MEQRRSLHVVRSRSEMDAAPGTRQAFDLATVAEADERPVLVPVDVIAGRQPGPRLVCAAGIHGDEIEGMVALHELAKSIDPAQLTGTLVLVPVVNPLAFVAARRRTPADDADLNRVFPGRESGSLSERHAERLFTEVVVGSDFLYTMHGASASSVYAAHVEVPFGDDDICRRSMAAAEASGIERIYPLVWHEGVLPAAANRVGIPTMEAEIGGGGTTDEHGWELYVATCHALLRHLGMLEAAGAAQSSKTRLVVVEPLAATHGGLWRRRVPLEAAVGAGDLIGTVHDLHGNVIEEVRATEACELIGHRISSTVHAGAPVVSIARPLRPGERPLM